MRAIFCERFGGPEHLVLREVPSPTPGPGEVKVALRARGVSFVDVLVIAGQYQTKREVPFIPGARPPAWWSRSGPECSTSRSAIAFSCPAAMPTRWSRRGAGDATARDRELRGRRRVSSSYATAYYGLQRGRLAAGEVLLCTARPVASVWPRSTSASCSAPP